MKQKILCAVHDPGGTKALAPVLAALVKDSSVNARILAGRFAEPWLKENGISCEVVATDIESSVAASIFSEFQPNVVFTGTSWGSNLEQMFRNEAYARNVPSVVFIDYWMNYAKRFLHATYPVTQAKDWIGVADSEMAKEVCSEGFPESQVVVTGHPHFDFLYQNRELFRKKSKSSAGEHSAIFLSEDYPESYLRSLGKHPIQVFAEAFSHWLKSRGIETANFHVKLHPKEVSNAFLDEALANVAKLPRLKFELVEQGAILLHLLSRYEFAFGFQSMALFEAKALGLKTLAIPLLKGDRYPSLFRAMELCGISFSRLHPREVLAALEEIAAPEVGTTESSYPFLGATNRLYELVKRKAAH